MGKSSLKNAGPSPSFPFPHHPSVPSAFIMSTPLVPTPLEVIQNVEEASYHGLPARRSGNRNDYNSGFSELAPPSVQADSRQYWESETSFSPSPHLSREEVNSIMQGRGNFEEVSRQGF